MAFLLFVFQHLRISHLIFASLLFVLLALDSESIRSRLPKLSSRSIFLFVIALLIAIKNRHGNKLIVCEHSDTDSKAIIAVAGGEDGIRGEILVVSSTSFQDLHLPIGELEFHADEPFAIEEVPFHQGDESDLALVEVTTTSEDPELGSDNLCRDLVPAPHLCDESSPPATEDLPVETESPVPSPRKKKKTTIKKKRRKMTIAPDLSFGSDLAITTTRLKMIIDVDHLTDCSIQDFNKACSAIIDLHRQEWQLR